MIPGSDLLMIQWQHLALRCCPQKWATPTGSPSMGSNHQKSGPPTGSHPQCHQKGEENYLHTIISNKVKPEQLILSKTYSTKVTINSRLLDMQDYKGLNDSAEAMTTVDPYF
jgi:hypothetical protein